MSSTSETRIKRLTANDIGARKNGEPIVALTSYHAQTAGILDQYCDLILVGDSVGMVMHGFASTLPVTLEMMIMHGKAVAGATSKALIVVDMPFGSYEESPARAFENTARVMKETGCGAIKLEGGAHMAQTIRYLVERGIPVLAHVGLTPQAINNLGSYRSRGQDDAEREKIEADGKAVAEAGAFAVVIEAVAEPLAAKLSQQLPIPTIGIGASAHCDGQILVLEDMLGLTPRVPKFVKQYADLRGVIASAVEQYARDVRAHTFPEAENIFALKKKTS